MSLIHNSNALLLKSGLVVLLTGLIAAFFHSLLDAADNWQKILYRNIDELIIVLSLLCMLTAGAAAGFAATFNAPLAGLIFVTEEM